MPDKFERVERNVMEIASGLAQRGLNPANDPLVRFFLDGQQVEYIEDEDIGRDWDISNETPLDSLDLAGLALTVEKEGLPETPFRRDMLEALASPEHYLGWNDLVDAAARSARSDDLANMETTAWWGVLASCRDGELSLYECWSPRDSGMERELIREMPLAEFLRRDAPERIRAAGAPKM